MKSSRSARLWLSVWERVDAKCFAASCEAFAAVSINGKGTQDHEAQNHIFNGTALSPRETKFKIKAARVSENFNGAAG